MELFKTDINKSIEHFFGVDLFAVSAASDRYAKAVCTFEFALSGDEDPNLITGLSRFCDNPPYSYWNAKLVQATAEFIRARSERLSIALQRNGNSLDAVLVHLFDRSWTADELRHDLTKASDVERLISVSIPNHLRTIEHIYGNALRFLWGVHSNGSFNAIKNALPQLTREIDISIGSGFNDAVRNALAHGEVYLKPGCLAFGKVPYQVELTSDQFENQIDDLWVTSLSIVAGILVGCADGVGREAIKMTDFPPRLTAYGLSGIRSYNYFTIDGAVEAETGRGREFIIFATASRAGLNFLTFECLKTSLAVYLLTGGRYDAVQFSIEAGIGVPQLSIINLNKLGDAYNRGVGWKAVDGIVEANLLWESYSEFWEKWQLRFRIFRHFFSQALRQRRYKLKSYVRKLENVSVGRRGRIQVDAVLSKECTNLTNDEIADELVELTKKIKRKFVRTPATKIESGLPVSLPVICISIRLYREDRSFRSLSGGGWTGNNLIASSEFVRFPWIRRTEPHPPTHRRGRIRMLVGRPAMFSHIEISKA